MELVAIDEAWPGDKWRARFEARWPVFRDWYVSGRTAAFPSPAECRHALARHMPELVPAHERLAALVDGDETATAFLTGYGAPPVISGCSVAVAPGGAPVLVRNYDFSPDFFEGTVLRSRWTGRRVLATQEALSGALDGVNEDGLAAALTFGGRPAHGVGFSIPILIRYVLETCATTTEAVAVLSRLPCAGVQNVALLDRAGAHAVVYLSPDRAPVVGDLAVCTNHQLAPEWPRADRFGETVERFVHLEALRREAGDMETFVGAFHRAPLHRTDYDAWLGTLYTAVIGAADGSMTYRWPDRPAWRQSLDAFTEGSRSLPA